MLSDINTTVRLTVVKVLRKFFETDSFIGGLRHFSSRFKERILEMSCVDADIGVRVASIRLCNAMRTCGFLENSEILKVLKLILDINPRVQREAVLFLCKVVDESVNEKIDLWGEEDYILKAFSQTSLTTFSVHWIKFSQMCKLLEEVRLSYQSSFDYDTLLRIFQKNGNFITPITQALLNACEIDSIYQSWEDISNFVLFDNYTSTLKDPIDSILSFCKLNDFQESILLQLLSASIQTVCNNNFITPKTVHNKQAAETTNDQNKDKDLLYLNLLPYINSITERNSASPTLLHDSLRLLFSMDLTEMTDPQLSRHFELLINNLKKFFLTNNDLQIIQGCTILFLRLDSIPALKEDLKLLVTDICDQTVTEFLKNFGSFNIQDAVITKDEFVIFEACLTRIEGCTSLKDFSDYPEFDIIYERLVSLLSRVPNSYEDTLKFSAINTLQSLLFWFFLRKDNPADEEKKKDDETKVFNCLINIMNNDSSKILQLQVYKINLLFDLRN